MTQNWQAHIPAFLHDAVAAALDSVYGARPFTCIGPIAGGASGAVVLRLRAADAEHLLRVEVRKSPAQNPHQYGCMAIAAEAGIAPPLHHVDAENGIALMDFIPAVPLAQFPGGPHALARAQGALVRALQETRVFPELNDFRAIVRHLLDFAGTRCVAGLLAGHRQGFEALCATISWDENALVSSHNDPNPRNLLFDERRLWLIDWETSYRNDAFVDAAILSENLAAPDLKATLVEAWLDRPATPDELLRLEQVALITKLYYAGMLLFVSGTPAGVIDDLSAPTPAAFAAQVAGQSQPTADILVVLAKMHLQAFAERWLRLTGQDMA